MTVEPRLFSSGVQESAVPKHATLTPREPGVSVAVPTRARPGLLEQCLSSVMRQTRQPDEVIVSQDGEDEGTREIVAYFRSRLPIRHLQNETPLGQLRNRTQALSATHNELVAMLDDDDEWEPTFLERTAAALERHPECAFCTTDHFLISPEGAVLQAETEAYSAAYGRAQFQTAVHDDVLTRELRHTCYSLVTTLFRREALVEIDFFPTDAGTAVDLGLFLELGAHGFRCIYLDERLGRYRIHGGQTGQTIERSKLGAGKVSALRGLADRHRLTRSDQELLSAKYRAAVIELAIAHAHAHQRGAVIGAVRGYGELGWGWPPLRRVAVLTALLLGARKRETAPRSAGAARVDVHPRSRPDDASRRRHHGRAG